MDEDVLTAVFGFEVLEDIDQGYCVEIEEQREHTVAENGKSYWMQMWRYSDGSCVRTVTDEDENTYAIRPPQEDVLLLHCMYPKLFYPTLYKKVPQ